MAHNYDSIIIVFIIHLIFYKFALYLRWLVDIHFLFPSWSSQSSSLPWKNRFVVTTSTFALASSWVWLARRMGGWRGKGNVKSGFFFFLILSLLVLGCWSCLPLQSFLQDCSEIHLSLSLRPRSGDNHTVPNCISGFSIPWAYTSSSLELFN